MLTSVTFEIRGDQKLSCSGCEQRVESLLKTLHGVRNVRAQASNQRIDVLFDTAVLDSAAILDRLNNAGYEARPNDQRTLPE
jgi:copper chaperone